MTNAEKYLKEGVDIEEFAKDIFKNAQTSTLEFIPVIDEKALRRYLRNQAKPTLTEDERVILSNMQPEKTKKVTAFKIKRSKDGDLWLFTKGTLTNVTCQGNEVTGETNTSISFYNHLFQFIKERRRILYKRIVGGEIMTVKELIDKLQKYDENAEVVIRFAIDKEDETGYILTPFATGKYFDNVGIYCEDENTEEDYNFIGQMSLKLLHNNTKRINDASEFVEYMCYDKEMKECVHDLKYSDCDKLLKILNGEEYSIEELLNEQDTKN